MSQYPLVSLKDVSVTYELETAGGLFKKVFFTAVKDVSLDIMKGESWAIVGESGSGKSTLALAVIGLLKLSSGSIDYKFSDFSFKIQAGKRGSRKGLLSLWKKSSIVFQDPYSALDSRASVEDIVTEPFIGHKLGDREEARKKAQILLSNVGLKPEHLEYLPDQLSGGQRQRVAIARALINDPELIIFDEPTSSLDVSVQAQILNLITDIKEKRDLTYIFITHNLLIAKHISEKLLVMYLGNVMEVGKTAEIFENPLHPYTALLISSIPLPKADYKINKPPILKGSISPSGTPTGCVFHNRCPVATEYCGWTSKEVLELIQSELYEMTWREDISFTIENETTFTINKVDENLYKTIEEILINNKKLLRYKEIEKSTDSIKVILYESWKPRMIEVGGGRRVRCIFYDEEFPYYSKIGSIKKLNK
ncbi:MAG: ABC transporter ATP-binding protein [Nitrososphaerota archaeon]